MKNTTSITRELKKFNKTISITVEIDNITEELLKMFDETHKRRVLMTKTINCTHVPKGSIGKIDLNN